MKNIKVILLASLLFKIEKSLAMNSEKLIDHTSTLSWNQINAAKIENLERKADEVQKEFEKQKEELKVKIAELQNAKQNLYNAKHDEIYQVNDDGRTLRGTLRGIRFEQLYEGNKFERERIINGLVEMNEGGNFRIFMDTCISSNDIFIDNGRLVSIKKSIYSIKYNTEEERRESLEIIEKIHKNKMKKIVFRPAEKDLDQYTDMRNYKDDYLESLMTSLSAYKA
ncbi:hypothetical protein FZC35_00830 [Candidatus Cytomitobacter indipagum]|uniref:Uncharacterized protein n=1 Tax=Candidatus Cytomitobacter indipagum TaxID=2601575 RepID=A0A5C0UDZ6_9PROT|nr:hypothetical protein [Candidatus Cytomitobacter indipagum]QEK37927.1 hypothetical protein FZC35_00830 [Candidatus Cytomitobacter indipagum]